MYKDLLVAPTKTAGDANALGYAVEMAARHRAHLTVLQTVDLTIAHPWGLSPDPAMGAIHERLRAAAAEEAASLRSALANESVISEVRVTESPFSTPAQIAAQHARFKDITVMSGADSGGSPDWTRVHGIFSELLLGSGRPVLVIPPGYSRREAVRHVMVAWTPTRESARALHDALPLLHAASSVDLLELDPAAEQSGEDGQPITDIAMHLERHGLKVNLMTRQRQAQSVASALLGYAEDSDADLLVAGGYGHSRLREWTLGGATRDLLRHSPIPVMYSH